MGHNGKMLDLWWPCGISELDELLLAYTWTVDYFIVSIMFTVYRPDGANEYVIHWVSQSKEWNALTACKMRNSNYGELNKMSKMTPSFARTVKASWQVARTHASRGSRRPFSERESEFEPTPAWAWPRSTLSPHSDWLLFLIFRVVISRGQGCKENWDHTSGIKFLCVCGCSKSKPQPKSSFLSAVNSCIVSENNQCNP